jgi:multidrug efflux pump subunit AcrA (membrane-fusion protein)
MKPIRRSKSSIHVVSRMKLPVFTWWLLIGGLPLAVWFGIQLGAAPQVNPPKVSEKPKWLSAKHHL